MPEPSECDREYRCGECLEVFSCSTGERLRAKIKRLETAIDASRAEGVAEEREACTRLADNRAGMARALHDEGRLEALAIRDAIRARSAAGDEGAGPRAQETEARGRARSDAEGDPTPTRSAAEQVEAAPPVETTEAAPATEPKVMDYVVHPAALDVLAPDARLPEWSINLHVSGVNGYAECRHGNLYRLQNRHGLASCCRCPEWVSLGEPPEETRRLVDVERRGGGAS